ncbi:MAG: hypothetical protein JSV89_07525 [Spirochaetaceae bacterium]|nr:MAG: hypothetical protein JSV89_07525 [Spirochaetaceae bacterium]
MKPFPAGSAGFPRPWLIGFLCAVLLLISSTVCAQTVETTLARSGYSEAHKDSIIAFFAQIENDGIPGEMLLPKLEEGIAKRVPAPKVLAALKRESENLQQARELILRIEGGERLLADRAYWARTANLLATDVSAAEIERLIVLCRTRIEGFRPASYLYVAMLNWGLSGEPAFDLIATLLASALPPDSYMGVMDLLATGRRRRIPPEELIRRIQEHLQHASTIKELEKWIY